MGWSRRYAGAEPIRLNKWLAQEGVCSRREADGLIAAGAVLVDGMAVTDAGRKLAPGQMVSLPEQAARALAAALTVVIHKPVGYVSAHPQGEELPAAVFLTRDRLVGDSPVIPGGASRMPPLGRLDQDSRGLLLLSDDGVLARAVIGPDSRLDKEYHVRVAGEATPERLARLRDGLTLDGRRLKPAGVVQTAPQALTFTLREGRNRQIRRMCELVGLRVLDLKRVRIGPLALGDLPEGRWRALTAGERTAMIAAADAPNPPPPTP